MNKSFKFSLVAASFILSSLLVGCGSSSSSTPDKKPGDDPKNPGKDPIQKVTKSVVVTDDYVVGATVYTTGKTAKADSSVAGKYTFEDGNFTSMIATRGGVLDLNNNNKKDPGEPNALDMFAKADRSFINPFTSFEVQADATKEQIKQVFGIENIDIDTTTADAKVRKAVVLANFVLGEAQYNYNDYKQATTEDPGNSENPDTVVPLSVDSPYKTVFNSILKSISEGKTLTDIIKDKTKINVDALSSSSTDVNTINELNKSLLNKYKKAEEPTKDENKDKDDEQPKDTVVPL